MLLREQGRGGGVGRSGAMRAAAVACARAAAGHTAPSAGDVLPAAARRDAQDGQYSVPWAVGTPGSLPQVSIMGSLYFRCMHLASLRGF